MAENEKEIIVKIRADASEAVDSVQEVKDKVSELNNTPVDKPFKSFKSEIKDAILEAKRMEEQFGKNSVQFAEAGKKVANLKDRFGEFNKSVEAFNPDNKLTALTNLGSAAVGSIQGVTGAMTLLGVESEDSGKAVAKLQALMALSGSLDRIDDIKNSFSNFGNVIKETSIFQKANAAATTVTSVAMKALGFATEGTSTGFKVLKGAIVATGIGALVIGLTMLVQNFDSVKKAVLNVIPGLSKVSDFIGSVVNAVTDFVGATSEAERATDKLIAATEKSIKKANDWLDYYGWQYDEYTKRKVEANKTYLEKLKKINEDETLSEKEKQAARLSIAKEAAAAIDKADSDRIAKSKEYTDKQAEDAKKKLDDEQKEKDKASDKATEKQKELDAKKVEQAKEISKLVWEASLAMTEAGYARELLALNHDKEEKLKVEKQAFDDKLISKEQYEAANKAIEDKYAADKKALDDQKAKDDKENQDAADKIVKDANLKNLNNVTTNAETNLVNTQNSNAPSDSDTPEQAIAKLQNIYDATKNFKQKQFEEELANLDGNEAAKNNLIAKHQLELQEGTEAHEAAIKEIKQKGLENTLELGDKIAGALDTAATIAGKNTVAGKALQVAAATIDTIRGGISAFTGMTSQIPGPVGIALGVVAAAGVVASGYASIKKILAVKIPGKGGSAGGGGSASLPPIGTAPQINSTLLSPDITKIQDVRVTNQANQPLKAYIVDRDLQANQNKQDFLNKLGSI